MRSSLYIRGASGERAVIDTGPEFRLQAVQAGITRLDGIFLTHAHADHLHGLDDIRPLCRDQPMPVYAAPNIMEEVRERFSYIFKDTQIGGGKPRIAPIIVSGPVRIGHLIFTPIPVKHGVLDILGWKITEGTASAAYITDTSGIPASSFRLLERPEAVIIGALRNRPHETHFSFEEALSAAAQTETGRIYLTHICHDHSHQEIEAFCRRFRHDRGFTGIAQPAYDGLELPIP
jgi:phosphoribosyl 1,2-cyclic phosphate phosphodiesterase